jgi:hypothetical protein
MIAHVEGWTNYQDDTKTSGGRGDNSISVKEGGDLSTASTFRVKGYISDQ